MRLTDWLTAQGWAERRDDSVDARAWGQHLTAAGRHNLTQLDLALGALDQALLLALVEHGTALKADLMCLAGAATRVAQVHPKTNRKQR